jgi:predicted glycoside hydrolase/deacetylase ChbG (UPF0249 family)
MKRLIVNADDFGWSESVTGGILRAHLEGVLTSTTLMANLPGAGAALERARREAPRLGIGLHLNLTEGRPLSGDAAAPLVDATGEFRGSLTALNRAARQSEEVRQAIAREWEAQAAWARDHGLAPTHLDSHKHVHLQPAILPIAVDLARRHRIGAIRTTVEIPVPHLYHFLPDEWSLKDHLRQWLLGRVARRWGRAAQAAVRAAGLKTTDWFFGVRATGGVSAWLLRQLLEHAPEGAGEVMVHPGLPGPEGGRPTRLRASRPLELEAVCDPAVRRAADSLGWTWATFGDLCYD